MGLWSWFSGPKVTGKDRAIFDLKRQRDKIKQYQKRIGSVLEREHSLAKQCLAKGDRQKALLFLRKEQFQKQLLEKTDQQLASLEELVSSIEFAQVQRDVAFGLEQGAAVLKQINEEMSLERVEKIMDDSAEGIAYQAEVEALLSEQVTRSDELEVERELAEIEAEQTAPSAVNLPNVPSGTPKTNSVKKTEDAKLGTDAEQQEDPEEELLAA